MGVLDARGVVPVTGSSHILSPSTHPNKSQLILTLLTPLPPLSPPPHTHTTSGEQQVGVLDAREVVPVTGSSHMLSLSTHPNISLNLFSHFCPPLPHPPPFQVSSKLVCLMRGGWCLSLAT